MEASKLPGVMNVLARYNRGQGLHRNVVVYMFFLSCLLLLVLSFHYCASEESSETISLDPLIYSSYLGGDGEDGALAVEVDGSGQLYMAGTTESSNFPGPLINRSIHGPLGKTDIFVSKINADGTVLLATILFGGSDWDEFNSMILDINGQLILVGASRSDDFPTTSDAYQSNSRGWRDGFIVIIDSQSFQLKYATLFGGSFNESGISVSGDSSSKIIIFGETESSDFPVTANAIQPINKSDSDGFVSIFVNGGRELEYSTYIGGSGNEGILDIGIDIEGRILISAVTTSTDLITTVGALSTSYMGNGDIYFAILTPDRVIVPNQTFITN